MFKNKTLLITGGTGSLGKTLVKRILGMDEEKPKKIIVFSRDEAKQHAMRVEYLQKTNPTDEIIYNNFRRLLEFRIGDVRDYHSVVSALKGVDVVFNTAALKQVPSCEYFPIEAVSTNILGPANIVKAIREHELPVETVIGISTDKACKPVNVMGMTKAIQERVFITANLDCLQTRFICVRYGNVLASRGSVIPLFHEQIKNGGPLTITTRDMTRFLLTLDQAVETIFQAYREAKKGETYIPLVQSSNVMDIAIILIGEKKIEIDITGIRPGEKIHEILVSAEEGNRTIKRGNYYVILPILPELRSDSTDFVFMGDEYSSEQNTMSRTELAEILERNRLMPDDTQSDGLELLR